MLNTSLLCMVIFFVLPRILQPLTLFWINFASFEHSFFNIIPLSYKISEIIVVIIRSSTSIWAIFIIKKNICMSLKLHHMFMWQLPSVWGHLQGILCSTDKKQRCVNASCTHARRQISDLPKLAFENNLISAFADLPSPSSSVNSVGGENRQHILLQNAIFRGSKKKTITETPGPIWDPEISHHYSRNCNVFLWDSC